MPIFEYGAAEIDPLKQCDILLGAAIDQIGLIRRPSSSNTVKRYSPYGSVASLYLWALSA